MEVTCDVGNKRYDSADCKWTAVRKMDKKKYGWTSESDIYVRQADNR